MVSTLSSCFPKRNKRKNCVQLFKTIFDNTLEAILKKLFTFAENTFLLMKKTLFFAFCWLSAATAFANVITLDDLNIRDPFILADKQSGFYYLYRSASTSENGKRYGGVEVYKSKDLKSWEGPKQVFNVPKNNWITGTVWAPEVHAYKGKYYLFATLNSSIQWKANRKEWPAYTFRGTQIFQADSPEGPFKPFSLFPQVPMDQMSLDGTLWTENGKPYLIYCHEWVQLEDGTVNVLPLADDLSKPIGAPQVLFHGSAAKWSIGSDQPLYNTRSYVTDGCFLYKTKKGKLLMIWSSFSKSGYATGIAHSATNSVAGPWIHEETPLFSEDGGHGMIFETFDGRLCLILHAPNSTGGAERAKILELTDTGETLKLK